MSFRNREKAGAFSPIIWVEILGDEIREVRVGRGEPRRSLVVIVGFWLLF